MRKIYRTLLCGSLLLFSLGFSSCEDYLDKEADSTVSEEEAFKNFRNFQGFIEEYTTVFLIRRRTIILLPGTGEMMKYSTRKVTAT